MLTEIQYEALWKANFAPIKTLTMPSYNDYLLREKFFETYLKAISGSEVKYILVAEAAPFHDKTKSEFGAYFYNYENVQGLNTPYFKAPCEAFQVDYKRLTPEKALQDLAKKGVILLDLFPFALKIDSHLRKKIAGRGILKHFWDEDDYSIKTQIKDLCSKHKIKLHKEWDLCLIAPPLISCHLVGAYDSLNVAPCTNFTNGKHYTTFKDILPNTLRGCDHKKVAVSTAHVPHTTLIKIAFDL